MMSNMERERGREKRRGAGSRVCVHEILIMGVGSFLDICVLNYDACGQEFQTRQGGQRTRGGGERDESTRAPRVLCVCVCANHKN